MTVNDVGDVVTGVLALVGATFTLLAGVGVLRFPDPLARMHAATKATSLGFLLVVIGAVIQVSRGSTKLAFAVGLVFLTAPVAGHLVGRSTYYTGEVRMDEVDELAAADLGPEDDEAP
ncbi:MAG TPA: monovalent cation/H(+) antiporter subunit G [Acidimicrobiales bacterium]